MYEQFFGLEDEPFRLTPDPQYLYLTPKHAEALAHLRLGLTESSGFVCITGDVGTGKTTLLRTFLSELGPNVSAAYTLVPPLSALELLRRICRDFGLPATTNSAGDLLDTLQTYLDEQNRAGRICVLVLDEAQALSVDLLEQIRLLLNLETETQKLLRIVLVGQPQLRKLLLDPDLAQLNQRITLRWHLGPLTHRETVEYVRHRLAVASQGRATGLFTRSALRLLHSVSNGVPRVTNMVAHRALLAAFVARQRKVTRRWVAHAYREIQALPLPGTLTPARKAALAVVGVAIGASVVVLGQPQFDQLMSAWPRPRPVQQADQGSPSSATRDPLLAATDTTLPQPAEPLTQAPVEPEAPVVEMAPQTALPPPEPAPPAAVEVPVESPQVARLRSASELRARLVSLAPEEGARAAVADILAAWNAGPLTVKEAGALSNLEAVAWRRGLQHLSLSANRSMLRLLDLPVILPLSEGGQTPRYVTLTSLDADRAVVSIGGTVSAFDARMLDDLWSGEAELLWKDFEGLGRTIGAGARGMAVARLQVLLQDVGMFDASPTGIFDAATDKAVRSFQRARRLEVDGLVGPFTTIVLYATADSYVRPSLASEGATDS
jgi:general secretion pathway protein A